jgi:hypothetical protein
MTMVEEGGGDRGERVTATEGLAGKTPGTGNGRDGIFRAVGGSGIGLLRAMAGVAGSSRKAVFSLVALLSTLVISPSTLEGITSGSTASW